MSSRTVQWINLPGEAGREFWRRESAGEWEPVDMGPQGEGCLLAVEAIALDSAPFWAVSPADGSFAAEGVAALRWEALGMEPSVDGKPWVCWTGPREDGHVLIGTAALAAEAPVNEWVDLKPAAFDLSARFFEIPSGEAALWKELGRYVVAFQRDDRLIHFATLCERTLGGAAAREIRDLVVAMEVNGHIAGLKGLRVWTEAEADFKAACQELLHFRVRMEKKPLPRLPEELCDLLPPAVARSRREGAQRRRKIQIVAALAALYVLIFAVWTVWLFRKQQGIQSRSAEMARLQPQLEEIRKARDRWFALQPATDPDSYPVEVFHRLVALLPSEGVQFEMFEMKQDGVMIKGKASSTHFAGKLRQDIMDSPGLKQYTWNLPQPVNDPDGRASFNWTGTLSGGGTHEGK